MVGGVDALEAIKDTGPVGLLATIAVAGGTTYDNWHESHATLVAYVSFGLFILAGALASILAVRHVFRRSPQREHQAD